MSAMSTDDKHLHHSTLSRRALLIAGAMGSIVSALPRASRASPGQAPGPVRPPDPPQVLVYDRRTAIARQTATIAAAADQWQLVGYAGDVTDVWVDTLQPLWTSGRHSVAGLSTPAGLFCIEQMAATFRMKVAMRCDFADGATSSRGIGPTGFLTLLSGWKAAAGQTQRVMLQLPRSQQVNGSSSGLVAWVMVPTRQGHGVDG
jgi:hypothetical protein